MSAMEQTQQTHIQAKVFDFALLELVRRHRESFLPLWTVDSWVKFLIWMTLNCGLPGEKESIELFVEALGPRLTSRMRRTFFERHVETLAIQLIADPAEPHVLVLPINTSLSVTLDEAEQSLNQVGLLERIQREQCFWQELDAVIAIPWQPKNKDESI